MVHRRGSVAVPSLLAGLALTASLPPFGLWPLAFLGAALLSWRLEGLGWRARIVSGWLAGLAWLVPALWWAAPFNWYGAAVLMAAEALAPALGALVVPARTSGWSRILVFSGAFTLAGVLRCSWPFGGLPIGSAFLGQAQGPLLDVVRLGGPYLLGGCAWLGGAGIAELVRGAAGRARSGVLALVMVAAIGVAGALAPQGAAVSGQRRVALVQGGGQRGTSQDQVAPATVFSRQLAATRPLLGSARPPGLVVWPEDVVRVGPRLAGTHEARVLSALARDLRATLVAGVTETRSAHAFRNEAVAWGPSGRVVGVYEKVHRVPFGEYVPYRSLFSRLADLSGVPRDAVPGHGTGLVLTPAGPLGVMVSFETFFATRGRSSIGAGAQLLVVPTNTASYASSQMPDDELDADRLQAVEEGRTLIQASPTGYSAVVRADGTVVARSTLGARALLRTTVTLRRGKTPYGIGGDVPVEAACALALFAGWVLARRQGRAERGQGAPWSSARWSSARWSSARWPQA